jgi:predicted Zn-dependent protease
MTPLPYRAAEVLSDPLQRFGALASTYLLRSSCGARFQRASPQRSGTLKTCPTESQKGISMTGGKVVNLKAVLLLTALAAALAVGVHVVHGFQVKRNAGSLLELATATEEQGDQRAAADLLSQYLGLKPLDTDARARYGLLLAKLAAGPRAKQSAWDVLEDVLRRDGSYTDVRRQAAALCLSLRRFRDAEAHLAILLEETPRDAELLFQRALCEGGQGAYAKAARTLAQAIDLAPGRVELWELRADWLRNQLGKPEDADRVMEELIKRNAREPRARLAATRYYSRLGQWDKAEEHATKAACELAPDDAEVLLVAADVAWARGKGDQARRYLQHGLARHPQNARLALRLAWGEMAEDHRQKALAFLRPVLESLSCQPEEFLELGDLLVEARELEEVEQVIRRLQEKRFDALADYLRARLLIARGQLGEGREKLERLSRGGSLPLWFGRHLHLSLADCWARLGNPDAERAALVRVLEIDPQWPQARLMLARCLVRLGKLDLAAKGFRQVPARVPEARPELVRVLLARNRRLPASERSWQELEDLLQAMRQETRPNPKLPLLQAEVLLAQGKDKEARKLAEAERKRDPKQSAPWLILVGLSGQQGTDKVLAVLDEAERTVGPRVEWTLARANYWAATGSKEQLAKLSGQIEQFQGAEREKLLAGLAEMLAALGDLPRARKLWGQLAQMRPQDPIVRVTLLEAALETKEKAEARRLLDEIRRLEGRGGPLAAYGEAAYLAVFVGPSNPRELSRALVLLQKARELRPSWSRVPLMEGTIHDLSGEPDKAVEKFKVARDLGDRRLPLVRRLAQLLYGQGQGGIAEADALLRQLPEEAFAWSDLGRLAAEVSLRAAPEEGADAQAGRKRALQFARKAVAAGSRDFQDHLWLGRMAALNGEKKEAEKAFQKACQLKENSFEAWAAWVLFLADTDAKRAEVELGVARTKVAPEQAPLLLAGGYEALGKLKEADGQYQAALAARPGELPVIQAAVAFYGRTGKLDRAEPLLRGLLKRQLPEAALFWARRTLALTLAGRRIVSQVAEAEQLLDLNKKAHGEKADDQRVRAIVLAVHPARRKEAIKLFEGLVPPRSPLAPEVRFELARLYEEDGNWSEARGHLLALLSQAEKNPVYLAAYVRGLLRHGGGAEAELWVDKLAAVDPRAPQTVDLRIRVLKAQGKTAEAAGLARAYAQEKDSRLDLAASWLEELGQVLEAEKTYRTFAASSKQPHNVLQLARFLGRHKRVAEALDVCARAWQTCRPEEVAQASVVVVRQGQGSPEQRRRVEEWLKVAIAKKASHVLLPLLLAELYQVEGRLDEAQALHRELLNRDPTNVICLNNLAYLLAWQGNSTAEALALVDKAIAQAGPLAYFLDTRALVYLKSGQVKLAVEGFQSAIAQSPSARRYLLLAYAQWLARDRAAASRALHKANEAGLDPAQLHLPERTAWQQLTLDLKKGGAQ